MEILIRLVDRSAAVDDSKAGDVIAINPDGWAWSDAELYCPEWTIIRSNITQAEADALLSNDPVKTAASRRRRYTVNLVGLAARGVNNPIIVMLAVMFRLRFGLKL